MNRISLTQNKEALVDDQDYAYLMQWKWYAMKVYKQFYAARDVGKRHVYMHVAVAVRDGQGGNQIDHCDRNGLNNQRLNLRPATVAQNVANQGLSRANKSGAKGVCWERFSQKWLAQVPRGSMCAKRRFEDFDEAVAWRDARARELHGEFAYLNGVV